MNTRREFDDAFEELFETGRPIEAPSVEALEEWCVGPRGRRRPAHPAAVRGCRRKHREMAGVARLAELITEDFYGRRLDFSARNPGNNDWRSLPEIEVTDRMPPTDAAVATDGLRNEKASGRTVRLFLTFVAAVNKMRDATQLWRAAGSLFRSNPEVFNPAKVCSMPPESLGKLLRDSGVTKYHKPQVLAWRRIAVSLASGKGPVCRVVDSGDGDAEELLRDVRSRDSRGPRYPQLRGDKIRLMWVRMMAEPGKAEIRRLETVPVAVDVQVRRVTENLGVTNTYGPELNNRIKKQIQQAWSDGVAAARIGGPERIAGTCCALDPALWFYGKHGCSHCATVKRQVRFGRACDDCRFLLPAPSG